MGNNKSQLVTTSIGTHPSPHSNHPFLHHDGGPMPGTSLPADFLNGTLGNSKEFVQQKAMVAPAAGENWQTATLGRGEGGIVGTPTTTNGTVGRRMGGGGTVGAAAGNNRHLSSPPSPPAVVSLALPSSSAASTSSANTTTAAPIRPKGATIRPESRKVGGGFLAQLFHYHGGTIGNKREKARDALGLADGGGVAQTQLPSPTALANNIGQQNHHQHQQQQQEQHHSSPKQQQQQQNNNERLEHFDLLPDRPAIRLDSRLVCKYEVLSVVGKGSFSQVLRVRDRITKRYFAVKLVSTNQDFGAVNNELTILGRVKHPFVIRLEEVFRSATKLFIVMEMASGGEMYDRVVAKGRYTEGEARLAIKMLLTGLDYLHRNMITHRDLKPENLLYSDNRPDARLLITDFGLAHQARNSDEKMAETCGTPEYIAPEILLRIPYNNKVDCWAVGVIAYILMSGIMPFDDDCRSRLYTHIITANYVYYPQFWSGSDQAKHFVDLLLETMPEQRPTANQALKHQWVTGDRATTTTTGKGLSRRDKLTMRQHWFGEERDDKKEVKGGQTTKERDEHEEADAEPMDTDGMMAMQRTRSSRSVRSVTRSDHGHRVDPREVDQLAEDLQRLAKQRRDRRHRSSHQTSNAGSHQSKTNNAAAAAVGSLYAPTSSSPSSHRITCGVVGNAQITKNYGIL